MTIPVILAGAGCLLVMVAWVSYMATIPRNTVPARPVGAVIMQVGGTALAIAGVAWSFRGGGSPGAATIAPAAVAATMGPLFLFILSQRKTPVGNIRVKVGDTLPAFAATTADGGAFNTDSLAGTRVLLKFFRGSW